MIKNAPTELYSNLSYITLSGARDFDFNAVSDLTAKLLFLFKKKQPFKGPLFVPKIEDPLDTII